MSESVTLVTVSTAPVALRVNAFTDVPAYDGHSITFGTLDPSPTAVVPACVVACADEYGPSPATFVPRTRYQYVVPAMSALSG